MTEHPTPADGKEHWAIGTGGTLHVPAANATSVCGADTRRAEHYRQLTGSREEWDVCDDCLAAVE